MSSKLDVLLSKVKKTYADAFVNVKDAGVIKRITLDSPQMNYVFGGGFAKGRIYELYGPESSGKTTICTMLAIQNQKHYKERPVVLYMDLERSFDFEHASELGLDVSEDKFVLVQPYTGEEAFEIMQAVIQDPETPVGLIVWDSIGATPTRAGMEDMFKAQFGGVAKVLSEGLKDVAPYLNKREISLVMINQERAQLGFSPNPNATSSGPGGFARKFWASWRARVTRTEWIKDASGEMSGAVMKIRNIKNKIGVPCREALITIDFHQGFNPDNEYMQFILDLVCTKEGQSYCNSEWLMDDPKTGEKVPMKIRGRDNAAEWLTTYFENNPEKYEEVKVAVNTLLCGRTILDADNLDEGHEELLDSDSVGLSKTEEEAWAEYEKESSEED